MFSTHFKLAIAAEEENNTEQAFINFQKCYELDPSYQETKSKYLSYFKKNFENENNKKSQDELKLNGNEYMQDNKFEEALIAYTAAIDLDPSVEAAAAIYSNRSLCYYNLEKYQEAYDDGCMASLLRPEWPRGWMRRATAAVKIENYEDAHECYEKYFELDPEGAKQDQQVVKQRNLVKKKVEQARATHAKKERRLATIRQQIMTIENENLRKKSATTRFYTAINFINSGTIDIDAARIAIECGASLRQVEGASSTTTPFSLADSGSLELQNFEYALRDMESPLNVLFAVRRNYFNLRDVSLVELDRLIRVVIDEMVKQDIPIPSESLGNACGSASSPHSPFVPANPDIMLALLHTNQLDPNDVTHFGHSLLHKLVGTSNIFDRSSSNYAVHPATMTCLQILLDWEGIDVNRLTNVEQNRTYALSALMLAEHPDVVKLLLRHGADIHAEGFRLVYGRRVRTNALFQAASAPHNPHQAELLRVLVTNGARLIADGASAKSSLTMLSVFEISSFQEQGRYISQDALQILLQLNKVQCLEMRFRDSDLGTSRTFLAAAIFSGAPLAIIEQLCAMDPTAITETSTIIIPSKNSNQNNNPSQSAQQHSLRHQIVGTALEAAALSAVLGKRNYTSDAIHVMRAVLRHHHDEEKFSHSHLSRVREILKRSPRVKLPLTPFDDLLKEIYGEEFLAEFYSKSSSHQKTIIN